jgi:hypothetical protein
MYFDNFPKFLYDFDINGQRQYTLVKDITVNVRLRKEILSNIAVYDEYDIKEGETPEIIAEKIYGSPLYHWVIMICNEKYDYINDYPLSTYELETHVKQKYGTEVYSTHHYIDNNGYTVDSTNANATSVSNYDYESLLNESKRRIKLISPTLLGTILKNFKDLV